MWATSLSTATGMPLMWWQMPLGRPRSFSGVELHYRDNRVQYFFDNPQAFIDAGGVGVVFGKGAPGQTDTRTDKGQFARAIKGYYAEPLPLP